MQKVPSSRTLPAIRWGCLALCVVLAASQAALAHAPSDIGMNFNAGTRMLSVTITHKVPDPASHYVKEVKIRQGDTSVSESEYTGQPSSDTFTYSYPIPAGVTGIIEVKAECNLGGERTQAIAISTDTPPSTPTGTTPGATTPTLVTFPPPTTPGAPTTPPSPGGAGLAIAAFGALAVLAVWWARR